MAEEMAGVSPVEVAATPDTPAYTIEDNDVPGQLPVEEAPVVTETNEQLIENTEGNEQPEDKPFSLDDITFEDDETEEAIGEHQFGKYNLDKYADVLPFDDEEVVAELNNYANVLEEQGFNQAQVEWLVEKEIRDAQRIEQLSSAEVQKNLNKNLSKEEKRNFKPIQRFLQAEVTENPDLGLDVNEIMSNPELVKLANVFYKKQFSNKPNQKLAQKYESPKSEVSPVDAMRQYREWVESQIEVTESSKTAFIKTILERASNREQLKEIFEGTMY